MGKIAEHKISTRRFCRYFVHAPLCIGEAFHGFEPTSILVDAPGEDIEFDEQLKQYLQQQEDRPVLRNNCASSEAGPIRETNPPLNLYMYIVV
jgi:hypothetical protein